MSDLEKARELANAIFADEFGEPPKHDYDKAWVNRITTSIQSALSQSRREGFEKAKEMAAEKCESLPWTLEMCHPPRALCAAADAIRALHMEEENAV